VEAGGSFPENDRAATARLYGLTTYGDLFTPRQLVALTTFSDLVQEARERVKRDAIAAGLPDDGQSPRESRHWRHGVCGCGGGVFGICD
jgi:adenine-specific DNA methylase